MKQKQKLAWPASQQVCALAPAPFSHNQLLATLSVADFELMRPHLRAVELTRGDLLAEAGHRIARAYFPYGGVISLVVSLAAGELIEAAMIGRDSMFGASAALAGAGVSLNSAIVRMSGAASMLDVEHLRHLAERSAPLRATLIRHEQALFAQAQQSAACNARHAVEARLSRCLLRMRDLSGGDTLPITQESLSQMLGVGRNSVSIAAHALRQAGLIGYRRGHIEIVDLEAMTESACECYGTVKAHCEMLFKDRTPGERDLPPPPRLVTPAVAPKARGS
jgi:CRP-like cAMP-binding protein